MKMVVHDGIRYRPEDAERLGFGSQKQTAKKKTTTKQGKPARHKARQPAKEPTSGDDNGS